MSSSGAVDSLVEIAVTTAAPGRYHYRVPDALAGRARVGVRVLVPFGNRKVTGVVVREGGVAPEGVKPLDVAEVLDGPSLPAELVELCGWIGEYYEAPPGEVLKAALPAGSNTTARAQLAITEPGRAALAGDGGALPPKHRELLAKLAAAPLAHAGMSAATRRVAEELRAKGLAANLEEREAPRVRLRQERAIALADGLDLEAARAKLARAPKRRAVLDALAAGGGPMSTAALARQVANASAAIRELLDAGFVREFERESALEAATTGDVLAAATPSGLVVHELTSEQAAAVAAITAALGPAPGAADATAAHFAPFLLHGVTGSGKTEVYLRVIAEALVRGKTAVVLVPEISLTPQLAARFRARFGDEVAILHSGMSDQARLAEWSRLRRGDARIAVGARSAVFAPLERVGVIVVDEEHDGSFKQDEGVRYHARDVALVRAQRAGAVCVLGSATPSLETYSQSLLPGEEPPAGPRPRTPIMRLVLSQRPTQRPMPRVDIVDLRVYLADGEAMLSAPLRTALAETLAAGDQAILFLNRRGFATFVVCRACGHSFRCGSCSVSLTYHRAGDRLLCHYCGHDERVPDICPECKGKETIVRKGLGTERVAAAITEEFASARVARLDRDVASGAKIETVLARVALREVDILVGTQMVTKGHDFPGVTLVGVLCADTGLDLPDFRASERTFQLLAQVAGRAGRGDKPGRVIVQTYRPSAHAVVSAAAHDYEQFFRAETAERAELGYPPHGRMIAVRIDGPDARDVEATANRLANLAEVVAKRPEHAGVEVRGAVAAPLERLRNRTRWQIWLRGPDRTALRRVARAVATAEKPASVRVVLDVDPLSAL